MVRKEDLMKKILFIFLFLFSIVCFTNIQTSAASAVAKGKCGKNATWIISEDGVMYIIMAQLSRQKSEIFIMN